MSYDLSFYKKESNPISKADIEKYLSESLGLVPSGTAQWFYENEDTGSYFSFEYYESDELDTSEDLDDEDGYEGFVNTNFSFNINFIRPQFFGKECFPLVNRIVKDLDLYVENPQSNSEQPIKYEGNTLEKEWGATNLSVAKSNFTEWQLNYLELEKSNYSWKYSLNRNALKDKMGEEYFVPGIFYIKKNGTNEVETMCVWPDHIPTVLPKVDLVLIQRNVKKLFRSKREVGLVRRTEIMNKLGEHFKNKGDYHLLDMVESMKLSKSFGNLKIESTMEDYGEGVSSDKIVNVRDN